MSTQHQRGTPDNPILQESNTFVLGFALRVPSHPGILLAMPPNNVMGLYIFTALAKETLMGSGIFTKINIAGSEMNDAIGVLDANSRLRGLEAIKGLLERCNIASMAVIGWWDDAEGIWRVYHPVQDCVDLGAFINESRAAFLHKKSLETMAVIKAYRAQALGENGTGAMG